MWGEGQGEVYRNSVRPQQRRRSVSSKEGGGGGGGEGGISSAAWQGRDA